MPYLCSILNSCAAPKRLLTIKWSHCWGRCVWGWLSFTAEQCCLSVDILDVSKKPQKYCAKDCWKVSYTPYFLVSMWKVIIFVKVFSTAEQLNVNYGGLNIWRDPFNQHQVVGDQYFRPNHTSAKNAEKNAERNAQSSRKVASKHTLSWMQKVIVSWTLVLCVFCCCSVFIACCCWQDALGGQRRQEAGLRG